FLFSQTFGVFNRFGTLDQFDTIDHREVEGVRNESGADPLDLVRSRLNRLTGQMLGDDRTLFRFDRYGDDFLPLAVFDVTRDTGDGAAGADAGHQDIDAAIGVVPDFGAGRFFMDLGIGRIFKLLRQEVFVRFGTGGQDQIGAKRCQYAAPLDAHGFRHGQGQLVATGGGHVSKSDAGVAGGRFDDLDARPQNTALLGVPDHVGSDAALDRIGGVAPLDFCQDGGFWTADNMIQFHQGGIADRLRVVRVKFTHDLSPSVFTIVYRYGRYARQKNCPNMG